MEHTGLGLKATTPMFQRPNNDIEFLVIYVVVEPQTIQLLTIES